MNPSPSRDADVDALPPLRRLSSPRDADTSPCDESDGARLLRGDTSLAMNPPSLRFLYRFTFSVIHSAILLSLLLSSVDAVYERLILRFYEQFFIADAIYERLFILHSALVRVFSLDSNGLM
ncbi:hypothetical protein Cni_G13797 [Canna indica]|uniref:Uncharacterized protein n=1 Tax=Canna indica TaxID=4628 RepID=A0AAQ3KBV0_9LILI|nr:hypothetical protein Cni_G13797 [Canna indica]